MPWPVELCRPGIALALNFGRRVGEGQPARMERVRAPRHCRTSLNVIRSDSFEFVRHFVLKYRRNCWKDFGWRDTSCHRSFLTMCLTYLKANKVKLIICIFLNCLWCFLPKKWHRTKITAIMSPITPPQNPWSNSSIVFWMILCLYWLEASNKCF